MVVVIKFLFYLIVSNNLNTKLAPVNRLQKTKIQKSNRPFSDENVK